MAKKTQTLLGRHTEIISEFKDHLAAAQRSEPLASDTIVRQKERLLASIDNRLATEKKAREATLARLDGRIAALEERSTRLRTEIEEDKKNLRDKSKRGKLRRDFQGVAGLGRVGRAVQAPGVTDIQGVGKAYGGRLAAKGIVTPADVAKAKPADLAATLSISEERAKTIIAAAKKVKQ